jgi:hypothetical protein
VDEAIRELTADPHATVEVVVDEMVIEMRRRRTAADLFREAGTWQSSMSDDELLEWFREMRRSGGSRPVPKL